MYEQIHYLGRVVTINGKIQIAINERIKIVTQFHHLVKGLLRNKDVKEKCRLNILKIYLKRILQYGAENWTTRKREDSKIQTMKIKFLRAILNEAREDRIRNTNIRLELGVDEIKMTLKRAD